MKKLVIGFIIMLATGTAVLWASSCCDGKDVKKDAGTEEVFIALKGEGKTHVINDMYSFTYEFNKKPKMGTYILKIKLETKDPAKLKNIVIFGDAGMPSMKGAHDTGDVEFKLNNKGEYLLPINFVMPGDWEVRIKFKENGACIYKGSFEVNV